jgi:glutathione S-transferase
MTDRLRLHYAPDNASLVIRLALEELGLPYETVLVDRSRDAQNSAAYRTINPNGLIPALETPDGPIFETAAILLWLADRHGALAPAPDSPERASFLKWLFCASNTLHADLRMLFYTEKYAGPDAAAQAAVRRQLTRRLGTHLQNFNAAAGTAWLGAGTPSVLDLYLACQLRWMALYPQAHDRSWFNLARYPALHALCETLERRASTRAAITAEGLNARPFTAPDYATPPEGSAT